MKHDSDKRNKRFEFKPSLEPDSNKFFFDTSSIASFDYAMEDDEILELREIAGSHLGHQSKNRDDFKTPRTPCNEKNNDETHKIDVNMSADKIAGSDEGILNNAVDNQRSRLRNENTSSKKTIGASIASWFHEHTIHNMSKDIYYNWSGRNGKLKSPRVLQNKLASAKNSKGTFALKHSEFKSTTEGSCFEDNVKWVSIMDHFLNNSKNNDNTNSFLSSNLYKCKDLKAKNANMSVNAIDISQNYNRRSSKLGISPLSLSLIGSMMIKDQNKNNK